MGVTIKIQWDHATKYFVQYTIQRHYSLAASYLGSWFCAGYLYE